MIMKKIIYNFLKNIKFFVLTLYKHTLFLFFFLFQFTNVNAKNFNSEDLKYYYNLSKNSELKKEHIKKVCGGNGEFSIEIKDCFIKENDKVRQAVMQNMSQQKQIFNKQFNKTKAPTINAPKGLTREQEKKLYDQLKEKIENQNNKKKQQRLAEGEIKKDELDYYYKLNYDDQLKKEHLKKVCGEEYIMGGRYPVEVKECFSKEFVKMNKALTEVKNSKDYKSPAEIRREKLKVLSPNERLEFQGVVKDNIQLTLICDIKDKTFHSNQSAEIQHQIDFVKNKNKYDIYLDGIRGVIWFNELAEQKMGMGDVVYVGDQIKHHPENLFNTKKYSIIGLEYTVMQYDFFNNTTIFRNGINPVTLMFNTSLTNALENKKGDFYLKTYFTGKTYSSKPDQITGRTEKYNDYVLGKCEIK